MKESKALWQIMTYHDCIPYYLTKQNQIMELTKQDKKHIQERVRKLSFRIVEEANAYMHLYEKTYYEEVIKMCQQRIDVIDTYHEQVTKVANNETTTSKENNGMVQGRRQLSLQRPPKEFLEEMQ